MRSAIVELRQYTLHCGRRDELIELFEREFIEPQEAAGIRLIGQFRVPDGEDRFVWLRGFADMQTRAAALAGFYDRPVWARYCDAANATMIDSDNVLLLHPAREGSQFPASSQLLRTSCRHQPECMPPGSITFRRRRVTPPFRAWKKR